VFIQQISLLNSDAPVERLETIGRAHKRSHSMTAFKRTPNNFQSRAACRAQYNQLQIHISLTTSKLDA
jgi:hypothetical protein